MTFGKLLVLRRGPDLIQGGKRRAAWYCKCSCGNPEELLISGDSLKTNHSKSCGCAKKDFHIGNNIYDLSGEFGICTMDDNNTFIFDLEDYDLIKRYMWHLSGREYIGTTINYYVDNKRTQKTLMLHRLVMGVQDIDWKECVVDHINGDVYDNRKQNLRVVTQSQNGMNSKPSKNNVSGATGVIKHQNKWEAYIRYQWERIYLGVFDTFDEAVAARRKAEEKYFGEFSYKRSRQMESEIG